MTCALGGVSRERYFFAARLRFAKRGSKRDVYEEEKEKENGESFSSNWYAAIFSRCDRAFISVQGLRRCSGRTVGVGMSAHGGHR